MKQRLRRINESIAWIVERGSELQDAGRTIEHELELSEGRRREAETELEAREVEMDRGRCLSNKLSADFMRRL